ncbi:MAG: hypothetical protein JWR42_1707 [Marmoricola sp.]|nr:hypothetical protein [Marmoricola sp.]
MVRRRFTTTWGTALVLLGAVGPAALVGTAGSAHAATTPVVPPSAFADWGTDLGGTPGAYVAKPDLHTSGFPDTLVASDSDRTSSVPSGLSTWWGSQTPPGRYWGSSQGRTGHPTGFLSVRPASDAPGTPSTTTLTFAGTAAEGDPVPAASAPTGWGFVVGDVDSESVTVSGVRADGQPATAEELGFVGAFNACASRERMLSCPTVPGAAPTWDADLGTLTGSSAPQDSIGGDAWFVPTVRLASVTLSSTWTSGSPVFQTWVVARTHRLTGTVSVARGSTCDLTKASVLLVDPDGHQIGGTQKVGADGTWSFGQTLATADLGVRLDADGVPGCAASSQVLVPVDLTERDARAAFTLAQTQGQDVAGSVKDDENLPVKGARVTLAVGSISRSATTGADGTFVLTRMPPNAGVEKYGISLTPPSGLVRVGTRPVELALAGAAVEPLDFIVEGTRLGSPSHDGTATPPATGGTGGTPGSTGGTGGTGGTNGGDTSVLGTFTSTVDKVGTIGTGPTYSAAGAYTSTTTSPTTSSLPGTGGPERGLLAAGAGLLLAGAGTVLVNRRRARA